MRFRSLLAATLFCVIATILGCSGDSGNGSSSSVTAKVQKEVASDTQTRLVQLYVATFGRAPDTAGMLYWVGQISSGVMTIEQTAKSFFVQPEAQAWYPPTQPIGDFIDTVYQNVLNRASDADGKAYWTTQLNSGAVDKATFVLAIINGALANTSTQGLIDAQLLNNKTEAGLWFATASGSNDVTLATQLISAITTDTTSVTTAITSISASTPLSPTISIASSGISQDIAHSDTNFLVGIESYGSTAGYPTTTIGAQLMDANGSPVGSFISVGRTGIATSVAFDGTNYLLIWEDDGNGTLTGDTGWQVYGQLISKTGQLVGGPFAISSIGIWFDGLKTMTYANGRYLATYTKLINPAMGDESTNRYVAGQLLAIDGSKVGAEFRISDGNGAEASVGTDGNNFIVAWREDQNDTEIRARIIGSDGTMGGEFSLNASAYRSDNPVAIAFDGTNYLVVWNEEVADSKWLVYGQRVSTGGALIGSPFGIATDTNRHQLVSSASCGGNKCLVTWIDMTNSTDWNFYGQYVNLDGTLSGSEIVINAESGNQTGGATYLNGKFIAIISHGVSYYPTLGALSGSDGVYSAFITP